MERRAITLEERKAIQLEMLREIDSFCRSNSIKYSLAFGTLLGAIRHKGFIPWDDDVDIMMPLPDLLRFKASFQSATLRYCDIDTERFFRFPFARVANKTTYRLEGRHVQSYGVCIDLYTVVSIPNSDELDSFFSKATRLEKRARFIGKWRSRAVRYLSLRNLPFFRLSVRKLTEFLRYSCRYGESGKYYIIAGPISLHEKMTYDFDMFDELIDVDFEDYRFQAISSYDAFLTLRYGDFMTPPPEDQRRPYHGGRFFWKDY